jgi:protein phosphatase 1 regulatory subunit 37
MGGEKKESTTSSSGAIEKLLGLFQHPGTFFSKSSSNQSSPPSSEAPTIAAAPTVPVRKESPMSGLFNWGSSKKDEDPVNKVLRNTSPDNTITASTNVQQPNVAVVDDIPKQVKAEMKENISPENTITIPSANAKVIFKLGNNEDEEESEDDIDTITNKYCGLDFKTTNNRLATSSSGISSSSAGSDGSPTLLQGELICTVLSLL